MKPITRVEFTTEEQQHIKSIANIHCCGIKCDDCPLYYENMENRQKFCIKVAARNIAKKGGFYE